MTVTAHDMTSRNQEPPIDLSAIIAAEQDLDANLRICGPPELDVRGLIDVIFTRIGLEGTPPKNSTAYLAKLMHERVDYCNGYGHPFPVVAVPGGLSILGGGAIPHDGVYRARTSAVMLLVVDGIALGVRLRRGGGTSGNIQRVGEHVLDRTDKRTQVYRRALGYNANLRATELNVDWIARIGGDALLIALVQFTHRHLLPTTGATVMHDEKGLIANRERLLKEGFVAKSVLKCFPKEVVRRHYRGPELEGLELDVWIPGRRIGVEYQGEQHDRVVAAWGGAKGLQERKERDERKRRLCKEAGITLVEFWHHEILSESIISRCLAKAAGTAP